MRFKYQQLFGNLASGVLTASRKWSLPDKDGTIAITSDVVLPNILINGNFNIAQRATTGTITAGTAVPTASLGYQVADNWFGYSIGANPTVAQIAGSGSTLNWYQITGVSGVSSIGIGQRIESVNAAQLAGNTATLSVDLSNSVLSTVTWTASYPTTTADTFGTIGTPTKTTIATGTFSVTSALTRFTTSFSCDSNVRKGLEIVFTVGVQTSGTWVIGNAKIEVGSTATAFVNPDFANELIKCQRLFEPSAIKQGAAVTVTAVPNIDWAIPTGVRRITFVADQMVIPIASLIRLGTSGGVVITGYLGNCVFLGSGVTGVRAANSTGFVVPDSPTNSNTASTVTLNRIGASNVWVVNGMTQQDTTYVTVYAGRVSLSGALTNLRFTPPSGNFTAGGTVQIMWEF